ncbi:homoserine kinase [Alloalcanivorax mobilis]|uniref:homoserine kinase n=1 Tax=Alloalcanivorax mobilis TaxID=2019569 RepID=UPI000C787A78|nr:homoserine kinase [Alloalcanivorax mobilis]
MSVYTRIETEHLARLLARFELTLKGAEAARHGIENSTFLIDADTASGEPRPVVLTVFEQFDGAALAPYLELLASLAAAGLPVPAALSDDHGQRLFEVVGKPAVLTPRLPGGHCFEPEVPHCQQIGALLARLHRQPSAPARALTDERQRLDTFAHHLCRLSEGDQMHARQILEQWAGVDPGDVPVHADLFRDNALFDDQGRLTGVLDFYNACLERPEYDLAVALNDWAVAHDGRPVPRRQAALLAAYRDAGGHWDESILALALAVAALRFWLSRLAGPVSEQSEGEGSKDPSEFARIFGYRFSALGGVEASAPFG